MSPPHTHTQTHTDGFLTIAPEPFEIQPWQVAHSLAHLRENMAVAPIQLPVRLIKEFSIELATPPVAAPDL